MTILQTINQYLFLLLNTPQVLEFYMSSQCLQKSTWASREPFPSDNLRTTFGQPSDTFGLFKMGIFPRKLRLLPTPQRRTHM